MSAYGAISRPSTTSSRLPPAAWKVRRKGHPDPQQDEPVVVMFHLTLSTAPNDLVSFLHDELADELERGDTYPQESEAGTRYSRDAFEAYFFAADVLVGIRASSQDLKQFGIDPKDANEDVGLQLLDSANLDAFKQGRKWQDCVAGFYYVKPNYPGRSSHICNAGFVVPFHSRRLGFARVLARSYLYYAPQLGYEASVFNLVYVNNTASIRLWDALGFTKAGRIPRAGRLKRKDGQGEEYVDAWIYYKSFLLDATEEASGSTVKAT